MSSIAFIGDLDSVWAFTAFGVSMFAVTGGEEARAAFADAAGQDYALIFVTEDVYEACEDQITELRDRALPAVTVLPNIRGSRGLAAAEIHRAVGAAVGADILAGDEGS